MKVRRYTDPDDVRLLIDHLCRDRVHVEEWLPKASLGNGTIFDLRVLVIAGEPCHLVVREGRGPMTNLHLGNRRGDPSRVLDRLGTAGIDALHATCRRTATALPRSFHFALDLLVTVGFRDHAVLEANAFGDLLPGVLHDGCESYRFQVSRLEQASSARCPAPAGRSSLQGSFRWTARQR